jgi:hypothetical protein
MFHQAAYSLQPIACSLQPSAFRLSKKHSPNKPGVQFIRIISKNTGIYANGMYFELTSMEIINIGKS